jgi:hypothetical protein
MSTGISKEECSTFTSCLHFILIYVLPAVFQFLCDWRSAHKVIERVTYCITLRNSLTIILKCRWGLTFVFYQRSVSNQFETYVIHILCDVVRRACNRLPALEFQIFVRFDLADFFPILVWFVSGTKYHHHRVAAQHLAPVLGEEPRQPQATDPGGGWRRGHRHQNAGKLYIFLTVYLKKYRWWPCAFYGY